MKFVSDESVDQSVVDRMRQDGHEVAAVADVRLGMADEDVLHVAQTRNAVLLTGDKDFGDLVYRQRQLTTGIVLLRLSGLSAEAKARTVAGVVREHASRFHGAFTVVTPGMVRIRGTVT